MRIERVWLASVATARPRDVSGGCLLFLLLTGSLFAQTARITAPIDETRRVGLQGTIHPRTRAAMDLGRVEPSRRIGPVAVLLKRSPEQQTAIQKLLAEQRNPGSPNFHKWLTPEQYADRFGLAEGDMTQIRAWIESHGMTIDHSARGRNWIGFSGSAQQIESALGTQIHHYQSGTSVHFANSTEVSIPEALAPVVGAFMGLNDFKVEPRYTNTNANGHSLAPDDLAIIYDILPLYNSGIDGTGQKIAIMGQSDLEPDFANIRAFRQKFNLSSADPQVVLYGTDPGYTGSEDEADLDLEWSGAIARNASLIYVNSVNVFTSSIYAIDQNLAPVISMSYAGCEKDDLDLGVLFQSLIQQANAQGITYVAISGDAGPSTCTAWFDSPFATDGLGAAFPASIPEITAVGGTEFNEGSGTYWNATNTANGASAISYIPERAWNDSTMEGTVQATGGGPSILYSKPPWQSVEGVPDDSVRDVPDVAMPASAYHDGYWACIPGGCFPDYGGTSFAAPVFAGIVALLNQWVVTKGTQSQPGLGNINPDLYRLDNAGTKVFHDTTAGDNIIPCLIGSPDCTSGSYGYAAGPGYDMTTGLGSVDVANLANSWNMPATGTRISIKVDNTSISMSASVELTITVLPSAGSRIPTGTVYANLSNTTTPESKLPAELSLAAAVLTVGSASVQIYGGQLKAGANTITVTYDGDAQFNGSSATITVNVTVPTTNSAVVLSAYPSYYRYQYLPIGQTPSGNSGTWNFILKLTNAAAIGTTVTSLSINGADQSSLIAASFGSNFLPALGSLQGLWSLDVPSAPTTIPVVARGLDASGFAWTTALEVPLVGGAEQFVHISNGGVVNAASFEGIGAPGMIMSVFGSNLNNPTTATGTARSLPLPLSLAGSSATVNGVPAPYYFTSYGQVNIQIPYETPPGDAVLTITGWIGQTFNYAFKVRSSAPGIFVDAKNNAPVPSETGSAGEEVLLYITGEGLVTPALATGASPAAGTPLSQLPKPQLPVTMTVAGIPAEIVFLGIVPNLVGATQINYIIPANAPSGVQPVVVTVGGVSSPAAFITVR